jgi:hypothetical protein
VRYRPGANASPKPMSPANVHKVFAAYWNLVATCCCAWPGLLQAKTINVPKIGRVFMTLSDIDEQA